MDVNDASDQREPESNTVRTSVIETNLKDSQITYTGQFKFKFDLSCLSVFVSVLR